MSCFYLIERLLLSPAEQPDNETVMDATSVFLRLLLGRH